MLPTSLSDLKILIEESPVFWFSALAGTGMFLIQFFLSLFGLSQEDFDEGETSGHFKWMSKQALIGFLMMFGWIGITCTEQFGLSYVAAVFVALFAGLATLFFIGLIFKTAKRLQSTGTVFDIDGAVGKEALVYQRIPSYGVGKITLDLNEMRVQIDAISYYHDEISSFTLVRVIKKLDDNCVVVATLK